jgi:hypothetical protein
MTPSLCSFPQGIWPCAHISKRRYLLHSAQAPKKGVYIHVVTLANTHVCRSTPPLSASEPPEDLAEDLLTLRQVGYPQPLVIQMRGIARLPARQVRCWSVELLLEESDRGDGPAFSDVKRFAALREWLGGT